MSRHVVTPFIGVPEIGFIVSYITEKSLHVIPYGTIGILIDGQ
jgi:hypothetical protein